VPFAPVGPTRVHYSADNVVELPEQIGGSAFTAEHVPELFYRMGDQVCFQTHTRARSIVPNVADRVLNDMSMICSPAREALNPRVKFASAWAHGSDVTDYARQDWAARRCAASARKSAASRTCRATGSRWWPRPTRRWRPTRYPCWTARRRSTAIRAA
jgi:hypothetical protein